MKPIEGDVVLEAVKKAITAAKLVL